MGTHPIFESDFDCLTEVDVSSEKEVFEELEKVELIQTTAQKTNFESENKIRLEIEIFARRFNGNRSKEIAKIWKR